MIEIKHPSEYLQEDWIDLLRNESANAENKKELTDKQLALFYSEKWFLALVPKVYGGLQWTLPEIVQFEEAIGWVEGSAGWVFTLCSGAGWFGGYLLPDLAKEIFKNPHACLAGSGAPTGNGYLDKNGNFHIEGEWKYASGAPHATIFTANCWIENTINAKTIASFCFLKDEIEISQQWQQIGLVASAGHSFKLKKHLISPERKFSIDENHPIVDATLYRFPFHPLAAATIGANLSGMTIHFMEECIAHFSIKKDENGSPLIQNGHIKELITSLEIELNTIRKELFESVQQNWEALEAGKLEIDYSKISMNAQLLAQTCRHIVNSLFPYCGLSIMNENTVLNRVWRDFQTGSQHAMFYPNIH